MPYCPDGRIFHCYKIFFERSRFLVRVFYAFTLFNAYSMMSGTVGRVAKAGHFDPLWPLAWIQETYLRSSAELLVAAFTATSLLAFAMPDVRVFRILVCIFLLEVAAIHNSFGAINHGYHMWFWLSFCLIFLPTIKNGGITRIARLKYLSVVVLAQGTVMFFYSLSGLWKVKLGIYALVAGRSGNFSPEALSYTIADRMLQTGTDPLLGPFFVHNSWLGWPFFLGLIYVQFVSFAVAFRPDLHQTWGYVLILFHFGTWLLMTIPFPMHVFILSLFFVLSPFRPPRFHLVRVAIQLPIIGIPLRRLRLASR